MSIDITTARPHVNGSDITQPLLMDQKSGWFRATWFRVSLGGMFGLTLIVGAILQAPYDYMFGQIALMISIYLALWILSKRSLINPIQAVVFLFYWWFGVAPTVTGGFYLVNGASMAAFEAERSGMEALWIVAIGLPLYALAARQVLAWLEGGQFYAKFLMPEGYIYRPKTLLIYWVIAALAAIAVAAASLLGIGGITTVNYLGGQRVDVWWVGVLDAISGISVFATSGIMVALMAPRVVSPRWIRILAIVVIIVTLADAVTSGSKGRFVYIFFYLICAMLSIRQAPPWRLILVVVLGYLLVVEPFVSFARTQAVLSGAQTVADRTSIFEDAIGRGALTVYGDISNLEVESLFRGIYPLAGELTRRNSWLDGYWRGVTFDQGLQALVPRALAPDKPDMNIGNFMAHTVGVDIGVVDPSNNITSVAVSIPFEFVGNYGWLAGIMAFPLIGLVWALVCGWLLSPARLSNHPLSPWLVGMTLGMEAPLAHYLASWRDLLIPLVVAYILWVLLKKQL